MSAKILLRQAHLGKPFSDEHRKNLSRALKGRLKGRIFSETTKDRIRQSLLGRKRPPEVIEKMRLAALGKKASEETKQKQREAILRHTHSPGYVHPLTGKKASEETRQKLRLANLGKKLSEEHKAKISAAHRQRRLEKQTDHG